MNIFKTCHPVINLLYFVFALIFSVIYKHPIYTAISFVFAFLYLSTLKVRFTKYAIFIVVAISLLYPSFNHGGITILTYLPDGNPLTAEAVIYGVAMAFSITSTLMWFICATRVLTTDKLMCIFGIFSPGASLMLSITLRFVPRFVNQMKITIKAQRGIGKDVKSGSVFKRIKLWMSVFLITVAWASENCIDISNSMASRGYGVKKRKSFSLYHFKIRDAYALTAITLLTAFAFVNPTDFQYFPKVCLDSVKIINAMAYAVFCTFPLLPEMLWNIKKQG